jgi:hypothetical protein
VILLSYTQLLVKRFLLGWKASFSISSQIEGYSKVGELPMRNIPLALLAQFEVVLQEKGFQTAPMDYTRNSCAFAWTFAGSTISWNLRLRASLPFSTNWRRNGRRRHNNKRPHMPYRFIMSLSAPPVPMTNWLRPRKSSRRPKTPINLPIASIHL